MEKETLLSDTAQEDPSKAGAEDIREELLIEKGQVDSVERPAEFPIDTKCQAWVDAASLEGTGAGDPELYRDSPGFQGVTTQSAKQYFDAKTRQFFTPTQENHKGQNIEVRRFKLNLPQPKVDRWHRTGEVIQRPSLSSGSKLTSTPPLPKTTDIDCTAQNFTESTSAHRTTTNNFLSEIEVRSTGIRNPEILQTKPEQQVSESVFSQSNQKFDNTSLKPITMETSLTHSSSFYRPDDIPKTQAKHELQEINTRLGNYIQFVREISDSTRPIDLASFLDTIKVMEQELVTLKNLYEKALQESR